MRFWIAAIGLATAIISAFTAPRGGAFAATQGKRQTYENRSSFIVDLGYEQYQGVVDSSTGFMKWKGYVCLPDGEQD